MLFHSSKVARSWPDVGWRRGSRLRTLAVAGLAFVVLLLPGRAAVAEARFWISASGLPGLTPGPEAPTVLAANGSDVSLYIWAQFDPLATLRNFSLNLVTDDPNAILGVPTSPHPIVVYNDPPKLTKKRFESVYDSDHGGLTWSMGAVRGLQGFTITTLGDNFDGIGPSCHDLCVMTSGGPAWLIGSVTTHVTANPGTAEFFLQIGANGMNYDCLPTSSTIVRFGPTESVDPDLYNPPYNAGSQSERGLTTTMDKPDFTLRACSNSMGDFNNGCEVDAGDYVLWRKNKNTNNALPNDNGLGTPVGADHYNLWRSKYGNVSSLMGSGSGLDISQTVPEPATSLLLLTGCMWILLFSTSKRLKKGRFP